MSTAPEPATRVVVDDEVARVADRVKATEVAAAELAAAAPRALRPEPGVGFEPPPKAPPKAAAPRAMAAMSEATMVATAIRRAPPAAGAPAAVGEAGPAGGTSALTRGPGPSTGASPSPGRTIRAVPVVGRPSVRVPRPASAPWPRRSRRGTPPIHSSVPLRRVWWAETRAGTIQGPTVVRRRPMVPRGMSELSAPRVAIQPDPLRVGAPPTPVPFGRPRPCCYPDPAFGGIAQLVERLTGSQEVRGSNPLTSTEEVQVRRWRAPRDRLPNFPSPRYPRANQGRLLGGLHHRSSLDGIARCPMERPSSLVGPPLAPHPWRRPPIGDRPDRGGRRCGGRWPDRDRGQLPQSRRAPLVEP